MNLLSTSKKTKKRPNEASGMERSQKSQPAVDVYDGAVEEEKVFTCYARIDHERINELNEVLSRD